MQLFPSVDVFGFPKKTCISSEVAKLLITTGSHQDDYCKFGEISILRISCLRQKKKENWFKNVLAKKSGVESSD